MDDKQMFLLSWGQDQAEDPAPWFLWEDWRPHTPVVLEDWLRYTKERLGEICTLRPAFPWPEWEPYAAVCVAALATGDPHVVREVCKAIISAYARVLIEEKDDVGTKD